jgi:hypothetical protein
MSIKIIQANGFAFLIPLVPDRYRANCGKEWGNFVGGDTNKMNFSQAEKAGLTKGDFVELALCWIDQRTLTFEPHYNNELFTEIWGIPTAGGMKNQFSEKASSLVTFLLHRQSKDKMGMMFSDLSRDAFVKWVDGGMEGDPSEFASDEMKNTYKSKIFRFEMEQTEGDYGVYFFVRVSTKEATTEIEKAALEAASEIYEGQLDGLGYCTDERLIENEQKCLEATSQPVVEIIPVSPNQTANGKRPKAITGK